MKKIELVNCDKALLELILQGDEALAQQTRWTIPAKWTEFGDFIFEFALKKITENPASQIWWTYLPILVEQNTLVGNCGYKGEPDAEGVVEIGYEVAEDFRGRGLATEIAGMLIDRAFGFKEVTTIRAHTLAEENASVCVLRKHNFKFIEALDDPDDGAIWRWELKKR